MSYTAIANTDLVAGYTANLIAFVQDREFYIGLEPQLYFDVVVDGTLTLAFDFFELTLIADITAFRFTPIDLTIAKGVRDRA